jgi:hypothetical protein
MKAMSKHFSWVNDDEQNLDNFKLSSIFPENLDIDNSLVSSFVPFKYIPIENLKSELKKSQKIVYIKGDEKEIEKIEETDKEQKVIFTEKSEEIKKSIIKFLKKKTRNLEKEIKKENKEGFNNLSLWHQKCLASVIPFGYCDKKEFSLVQTLYNFNFQNKHVIYSSRFILGDHSRLCSSLIFLSKLICSIEFEQTTYKEKARQIFERLKYFFNISNDVLYNLHREHRSGTIYR